MSNSPAGVHDDFADDLAYLEFDQLFFSRGSGFVLRLKKLLDQGDFCPKVDVLRDVSEVNLRAFEPLSVRRLSVSGLHLLAVLVAGVGVHLAHVTAETGNL